MTTEDLTARTEPAAPGGGTPGAPGGPAGSPQPAGRRPASPRRRLFTLLVVILLIGVPAGYIAVSAGQSRDSGEDKQARAAATGLTAGWPSKVTRRIYDVPITGHSADVAWYETNSWNTSKFYAQFVTSDKGLDLFLRRIDSSRSALREGRITVSEREAAEVGWKLGPGKVSDSSYALDTGATKASDWSGMVRKQRSPEPTLDVTVDFSNPAHPKVYVVSTVKL